MGVTFFPGKLNCVHPGTLKVCCSALLFVHEAIEFDQSVTSKLSNPLPG